MTPRTGRPTEERKGTQITIRLSDSDLEKLEYCHEVTGLPKQQILRNGLYETYAALKAQEGKKNG